MIYNKIGNLFINYEIFNTIEIRNEFENKINLIIEESINNYLVLKFILKINILFLNILC